MDLPVTRPVKPMLAKAVDGIPEIGDLAFEPKWDGFRCIVFRDGDEVHLGSRNEKPLTRYFPELIEPLLASLPDRCVVDGEIIVTVDDHLGFDSLQQRIHPAESSVTKLSVETPPSSSPSMSSRSTTRTSPMSRSATAVRFTRPSAPRSKPRSTSCRPRSIARSPTTGTSDSRVPAWTA
jgi:hypothetical protein